MSEFSEHQTEAAVVAEVAKKGCPSEIRLFDNIGPNALPVVALITPKDRDVKLIDHRDYAPRPKQREGDRSLYTLADFLAYVNVHKEPAVTDGDSQPWNPHIFLDRDGLRVRCSFDYSQSNLASHQKFTASHALVFSKEIEPWRQKAERWLTQLEFAEWIEDHELEFVKPSSAEMLTLAQKFEASISARFSSKHNLATGEIDLAYKLENNEAGSVKVPDEFTIALPIFKGGERYQLPMRLRHRCRDGAVTFLFKFKNLDQAVDDVWSALIKTVREAALCPTFEVA